MWPGPSCTSGLRLNSPGVCEPPGSASISVTMAIFGRPEPHSAHRLVGMPALALHEPIIIAGQNGTLAPCERQERYGLRFVQNPNRRNRMRFEGTPAYVATDDLKVAVNAAITLERPLLVKGERGTGKTVLALEVAKAIGAPLIEWHIKSTTKALQGLYEYDAVSRLRDSQFGDARVQDIRNYIKRGKLCDAFVCDERPVLLIDEIDKADIEFPNDLLHELDRM